jgi:hypothetical protein
MVLAALAYSRRPRKYLENSFTPHFTCRRGYQQSDSPAEKSRDCAENHRHGSKGPKSLTKCSEPQGGAHTDPKPRAISDVVLTALLMLTQQPQKERLDARHESSADGQFST